MKIEQELSAIEQKPSCLALLPFAIFLIFYLGLSLWARDFYLVPMPVAFLVAGASAVLFSRRRSFNDKIESFANGMGHPDIMIMCLIFILAGAFAGAAKAMGAVDATVNLALNFIPPKLMLGGIFMVSCFISLAIGTSVGTISALSLIALGIAGPLKVSPAVCLAAVVGGAMFGDNLSMISDTTIAATRTQGVNMRDKFLTNVKIALPAAMLTLGYYIYLSHNAGSVTSTPLTFKTGMAVLPYILVLVLAVCGINVMALLFLGTLFAGAVGLWNGAFTLASYLKAVGAGALNMSETLIVALLAGGLLRLIRENGGIAYLLLKIESCIRNRRGAEFGIALLVAVINLFTANNTVAIVIAGPVARDIATKYGVEKRRSASILDTTSCVIQGIIPYGAQILVAIGLAASINLKLSSFDVLCALYYPIILALTMIFGILCFRPAK